MTPHAGRVRLFFLLAGTGLGLPLGAQDVELLGEYYGTRPPDVYFESIQRDPAAFRFSVEGNARLEGLRQSPLLRQSGPAAPGGPTGLAIGPRDEPLVGEFRFPLILGLYSDGVQAPPFSQARIQEEYFDGPNSYIQTIPELYTEMSRGLLQFEGTSYRWVQTGLTKQAVAQTSHGLSPSLTPGVGVGSFIEAILGQIDDGTIDWSQYDVSGDGYVDFISVLHPTRGGECVGSETTNIWSHRWSLDGATSGRLSRQQTSKARDGYETSTPYAGGGKIHINDYTIQAVLDCTSSTTPGPGLQINRIGVFAHELGHALGLPDLYNTADTRIPGTGVWDLMGTGAWGCNTGNDSARPCHLGAWSKAALGWVVVEEIGPGVDRVETLAPVETTGRVLRVPASDGSSEYLLLENRQRIGSDVNLLEPGLLIWHVDPVLLDPFWPQNGVNAFANRPGVWLRQADGQDHLSLPLVNRGDAGDPFPGCIVSNPSNPAFPCVRNPAFHVGTVPRAITHSGHAMGISLTGIELLGVAPHDVRFRVDTRFTRGEIFVDARIEAVKDQNVAFEIAGVPAESLQWRLVSGVLPGGLTFQVGTGLLQGVTFETGTFDIVLGAAEGPNQETQIFVELTVVPPVIPREELVNEFLGRPNTLSLPLRQYLDNQGNQNGALADLGDVRAYLQANPNTPESAAAPSLARIVAIPPPFPERVDP
jgi:M6 family metalloprotease-like protein